MNDNNDLKEREGVYPYIYSINKYQNYSGCNSRNINLNTEYIKGYLG